MPFFTAKRRDNKKEKQFLAEIYGQKESMIDQQLSVNEINRMREIVAASDKQAAGVTMDLSKPIIMPNPNLEYPKTMYNHEQSDPGFWAVKKTSAGDDLSYVNARYVTRMAKDKADEKDAVENGWSTLPPVMEDVNTEENPYAGFGRPERQKKNKKAS